MPVNPDPVEKATTEASLEETVYASLSECSHGFDGRPGYADGYGSGGVHSPRVE